MSIVWASHFGRVVCLQQMVTVKVTETSTVSGSRCAIKARCVNTQVITFKQFGSEASQTIERENSSALWRQSSSRQLSVERAVTVSLSSCQSLCVSDPRVCWLEHFAPRAFAVTCTCCPVLCSSFLSPPPLWNVSLSVLRHVLIWLVEGTFSF